MLRNARCCGARSSALSAHHAARQWLNFPTAAEQPTFSHCHRVPCTLPMLAGRRSSVEAVRLGGEKDAERAAAYAQRIQPRASSVPADADARPTPTRRSEASRRVFAGVVGVRNRAQGSAWCTWVVCVCVDTGGRAVDVRKPFFLTISDKIPQISRDK